MKHILAVRVLSYLANCAAQLVLGVRWLTPSASQWAKIDAMYAQAEAHHEFICIYTPLGDMIRGSSFDRWLHAPGAFHAAVEVWIVSGLIFLCASWLGRHIKAEQRVLQEGEV